MFVIFYMSFINWVQIIIIVACVIAQYCVLALFSPPLSTKVLTQEDPPQAIVWQTTEQHS